MLSEEGSTPYAPADKNDFPATGHHCGGEKYRHPPAFTRSLGHAAGSEQTTKAAGFTPSAKKLYDAVCFAQSMATIAALYGWRRGLGPRAAGALRATLEKFGGHCFDWNKWTPAPATP